MVKKLLLLSVIIAIGAFALTPLIALNSIKTGIETNNAKLLSENVDFANVRQSLKAQVKAYIKAKMEKAQAHDRFAALGMRMAGNLADGIVDTYVTPAGLAELMRGQTEAAAIRQSVTDDDFGEDVVGEDDDTVTSDNSSSVSDDSPAEPDNSAATEQAQVVNKIPEELFENTSFGYISFNDFKVDITNKQGRTTTLLLSRDGLAWRLSNILLPLDKS